MKEELFEDFIIKCCELDEWDLRDFLKKELSEAGFSIKEDDYTSRRPDKYKTIRNLLAVRGNSPRTCLVAHTDVCRDHSYRSQIHQKAKPVIKEISTIFDKKTRIIQDENNKVQVGGDDRLGVAINTWIALNTGYDMALLFTTDEEIGAISADYLSLDELNDFDLLIQVDRGNNSNQLVTSISGVRLCSDSTAKRLINISKEIGLPRYTVRGLLTDVLAIRSNNKCREAVNMTCGYHNSYGASANEFINIEEAKDTLKYVSAIIQDYEMKNIEDIEKVSELIEESKTAIQSDSIQQASIN